MRRTTALAVSAALTAAAASVPAPASALSAAGLDVASVAAGSAAGSGLPSGEVVTDACVAYAMETSVGNWTCGDGVLHTFIDGDAGGPQRAEVVVPARAVDAMTGGPAGTVEASGTVEPTYVIDESHAKRTTTWYYGTGGTVSGRIRFTFNIGLHGHSANVWMTARADHPARLTWRTRIREDKNLMADETVFTYPDTHGCSLYTYTCEDYEDRYGDGYDRLPYRKGAKVFWEAYNTSLIIAGEAYPGSLRAQSDRATCYITVRCKFLG